MRYAYEHLQKAEAQKQRESLQTASFEMNTEIARVWANECISTSIYIRYFNIWTDIDEVTFDSITY